MGSLRAYSWAFAFFALAATNAYPALAQQGENVTIGVDSPAALFSPGNWSGDSGRGGSLFRQSWVPGAWVKFYWTSTSEDPSADLQITDSVDDNTLSYFVDGNFTGGVHAPSSGTVSIKGLSGSGKHELDVYVDESRQEARWNDTSAWRVTGLSLSPGSTLVAAPALRPWVLEIGDSITEGVASDNGASNNLTDYSFLTGQALNQIGYDYSVSACGWSGWIYPGDDTQDVPPLYAVHGGKYDESGSRWDKINQNTSLMDSAGKISANGHTGTAPAMITINYGTNEALHLTDFSDLTPSIEGGLAALRRAAPKAWIVVYVPFNLYSQRIYPHGQEVIDVLKHAVTHYKLTHSGDSRTVLVDFGPTFSQEVVTVGGGDIHPNLKGHELIATKTIATVVRLLASDGGR